MENFFFAAFRIFFRINKHIDNSNNPEQNRHHCAFLTNRIQIKPIIQKQDSCDNNSPHNAALCLFDIFPQYSLRFLPDPIHDRIKCRKQHTDNRPDDPCSVPVIGCKAPCKIDGCCDQPVNRYRAGHLFVFMFFLPGVIFLLEKLVHCIHFGCTSHNKIGSDCNKR